MGFVLISWYIAVHHIDGDDGDADDDDDHEEEEEEEEEEECYWLQIWNVQTFFILYKKINCTYESGHEVKSFPFLTIVPCNQEWCYML